MHCSGALVPARKILAYNIRVSSLFHLGTLSCSTSLYMAGRFAWLPQCKLLQLEALAHATGINSSGTKKAIADRLADQLEPVKSLSQAKHGAPPQSRTIVSIDMGIRNLAYCRLALPSEWPSCHGGSPLKPVLREWERIDVVPKPGEILASPNDTQEKLKEAFEPHVYAEHAYNLILKLTAEPAPSEILIERQRFRNMGGSSVLEWTLRVNMFESMLYAVIHTLQKQGHLGQTRVIPMSPDKVGKFWIRKDDVRWTKEKKVKKLKVDLVTSWVNKDGEGEFVANTEQVAETIRAWRRNILRDKHKKNQKELMSRVTLKKLDDLADCLLQGLAWVKWEENKKTILKEGINSVEIFPQRKTRAITNDEESLRKVLEGEED